MGNSDFDSALDEFVSDDSTHSDQGLSQASTVASQGKPKAKPRGRPKVFDIYKYIVCLVCPF